ncbi:hypothetical protein OTU49_012617 [Cherax quadricarinatus]|uniref:Uncharacterized protein n=1 Tax=Cherax quadricarinatus TaxID=27406 RepID=A0AAW0VR08_CHEQU
MKVLALQKLSWDVVIEWLHSFQLEDKAKVLAVYQYLLPAAPLLAKLAASCQYYDNPHLTQLFLPILVLKGKIHVTTYNIKQVLSYWEDSLHNSGVSHITHLKVEDITSQQYLSFLPLLGHLTNLQVLVIGSFVGDDLLAVLGMNCHHLVIFDVREEDMGNLITDVGLAFLAHCRKLRRVYFSEFADEYDCSDEQLRFTGKGVSLLLLLPEIEHIQCSEYILRDALHFLYQATYNKQTIAVQHLMLDHEEVTVNTLQTLPILCPKLEVLALRSDPGNETTIGRSLKLLPHLKMLIMTVGSVCRFQDLMFSSYGPQLTFLYLTSYLLESQDLIILSQSCTQLKTFVLKMHSFGFDISNSNSIDSLFPTVEKLELMQNISVRLFKILNAKMKNLQEVHCMWATIYNLNEALEVVIEGGGWRNVQLLVLPVSCEIKLQTAQMVATALPNLKSLAVSVHQPDERKFWNFVEKNFPNLERINLYPVLPPSSTGIFSQDPWNSSWVDNIGKRS